MKCECGEKAIAFIDREHVCNRCFNKIWRENRRGKLSNKIHYSLYSCSREGRKKTSDKKKVTCGICLNGLNYHSRVNRKD